MLHEGHPLRFGRAPDSGKASVAKREVWYGSAFCICVDIEEKAKGSRPACLPSKAFSKKSHGGQCNRRMRSLNFLTTASITCVVDYVLRHFFPGASDMPSATCLLRACILQHRKDLLLLFFFQR